MTDKILPRSHDVPAKWRKIQRRFDDRSRWQRENIYSEHQEKLGLGDSWKVYGSVNWNPHITCLADAGQAVIDAKAVAARIGRKEIKKLILMLASIAAD